MLLQTAETAVLKCDWLMYRNLEVTLIGTHYVYWAPLIYTVTVQFMFR